MLGRRIGKWLGLALGMALAFPGTADAQRRGVVAYEFDYGRRGQLRFNSGYITQRIPRMGLVHVQPVRYERVRGIRIPHRMRPARGLCRLWHLGVAPRHQPAAMRCDALRGRFHRDVLVVTWRGVVRPVVLSSRLAFYRNPGVRSARLRSGRVAARVQAPHLRGAYPRYKEDARDRYGYRYDFDGRWDDDRWDDDWWEDRFDDDRFDDDRFDDDRWDDDRWDDDDDRDRDRRDRDGRRNGRDRDRRGLR